MTDVLKAFIIRVLPFVTRIFYGQAHYVWVIHPLTLDDVVGRYKFLRVLPRNLVCKLIQVLPPIVLSKISGLKNSSGLPVNGYLVGCFLLPDQIRKHRNILNRKIIGIARMSHRLGVYLVGIGGVIVVDKKIEQQIKSDYGVTLTNGTATACVVMRRRMDNILSRRGMKYSSTTLAIVNSTSLKGRLISRFWAQVDFTEILLLGRNKEHLEQLKRSMAHPNVKISTSISDMKTYDVVMITPSYNRLDFKNDYFKDGMIIYDINDPHYDFSRIINLYPSLEVHTNGLISTKRVNRHYDLGVSDYASHVCLAETYLLAMAQVDKGSYFNDADLNSVRRLDELFTQSDFDLISEA